MARLTTSGTIKFSDLSSTFSDTNPINLSDYYKGGTYVPSTPQHSAVPTAGTIKLSNLYGGDVYTVSISPAAFTLDEGGANDGADPSTKTFTVTDTGFSADTTGTLYWRLEDAANGTGSAATTSDFSAISGSITMSNSSGTVTINVTDDNVTEGTETWYLNIFDVNTYGAANLKTSSKLTVLDTSITPAAPEIVSVTPTATNYNEGSSAVFNIVTTGFPAGTTTLNVTYNYTNASAADHTGPATVDITGNAGTLTIPITADTTTESPTVESFTVTVAGTVSATALTKTSTSVTINDTSVSTPTVTVSNTTITEGGGTVSVTYANLVSQTITLALSGGTLTAADFDGGSLTFTSTSLSGSGTHTFAIDTKNDLSTSEGDETATMTVSTTGATNATATLTVTDSSQAALAGINSVTASTTTPSEGTTVTFTVSTSNFADGTTTLNLTPNYTNASAADFTTMPTTVTITSSGGTGSGTFDVVIAADATTEAAAESFTMTVAGNAGTPSTAVTKTSAAVTITDSSQTPAPSNPTPVLTAPGTFNGSDTSKVTLQIFVSSTTIQTDGTGVTETYGTVDLGGGNPADYQVNFSTGQNSGTTMTIDTDQSGQDLSGMRKIEWHLSSSSMAAAGGTASVTIAEIGNPTNSATVQMQWNVNITGSSGGGGGCFVADTQVLVLNPEYDGLVLDAALDFQDFIEGEIVDDAA